MKGKPKTTYLISACLVGGRCRYDGGAKAVDECQALVDQYNLVPVCPEQLGGLATPRPAAEIRGGDGADVLAGRAGVFRVADGVEVTERFVAGAEEAMRIAELVGATGLFLKGGSPSCGCGRVVGVCAALAVSLGYPVRELA